MKRCFYFSVLALFALFMSGCMTSDETISFSYRNPLIRFTNNGLMFRDEYVTPKKAMELMEKHRIPKNATIHLLVDEDYRDERAMWVFQRNYLARAGYTKSVLIRNTKPEVKLVSEEERRAREQAKEPKRTFRYKRANER
jgi:hypothetical protein